MTKGDIDAATKLFAVPAIVANNTPQIRLETRLQVRFFNQTLPCGGTVVATERRGRFVVGTFRLTDRPGGDCGAGTGHTAKAAFDVRKRQDRQVAARRRGRAAERAGRLDWPLGSEPVGDERRRHAAGAERDAVDAARQAAGGEREAVGAALALLERGEALDDAAAAADDRRSTRAGRRQAVGDRAAGCRARAAEHGALELELAQQAARRAAVVAGGGA